MLTWIWGVVFLASGMSIIARHAYVEEMLDEMDDDEADHQGRQALPRAIMGLCFVMLSVIATWDSFVHPLFAWLSLALPEPDTTANTLTAVALTAGAVLAYVLAVPLVTILAVSKWVNRRNAAAVPSGAATITHISRFKK